MGDPSGHGRLFDTDPGGRPRRDRGRPPVDVGRLFDRLPPHSLEAEMSLLGSMILDPRVMPEVVGIVAGPDDFYKPEHGVIYSALVEVFDAHASADLVPIVDAIRGKGRLDEVGGVDYLVGLAEAVPSAVNAPAYARILAEKAKLRRLIEAAGRVLYDAYHAGELGPEGAREVIDGAEQAIFQIAHEERQTDPQRLADLLQIEIDRLEPGHGGFRGVPTGYADLDRLLLGLHPGEMVIIAGRPSMGKTSLALNLAEQVALGGATPWTPASGPKAPVAFFSLEMSKRQVVHRLLSAYSGVDSQKMRSGELSADDFRRLQEACHTLDQAPIFVDDAPNLTVLALRARARRMVAEFHAKAIMIDYLQLLTAPSSARESRQVEVSAISRGIKHLARELNVPVVCLAQLNRQADQREGNRPRMSDLRESGSIEQDADVVILIHREDYYHKGDEQWLSDPDNQEKVGVTELIVAKQRNGPVGTAKLTWDDATTRFKNSTARGMYGEDPFGPGSLGATPRAGHGAGPPHQPGSWHAAGPGNGPGPARGSSFPAGRRTGPVEGHRDGGGPDPADDEPGYGDLPV